MSRRVFVEGGGDKNKALAIECRRGFSEFFRRAGMEGNMPRVIACGSRHQAYSDFRTHLRSNNPDEPLLLVDSEGPVTFPNPWHHVKAADNWDCPAGAAIQHLHLMVQCMEAWFLSDTQTLRDFYGQHFQPKALPLNPNIESISKAAILSGLKAATSNCLKGQYSKGGHAFQILARISPLRLASSSPHVQRLLDALGAPIA